MTAATATMTPTGVQSRRRGMRLRSFFLISVCSPSDRSHLCFRSPRLPEDSPQRLAMYCAPSGIPVVRKEHRGALGLAQRPQVTSGRWSGRKEPSPILEALAQAVHGRLSSLPLRVHVAVAIVMVECLAAFFTMPISWPPEARRVTKVCRAV